MVKASWIAPEAGWKLPLRPVIPNETYEPSSRLIAKWYVDHFDETVSWIETASFPSRSFAVQSTLLLKSA